MIILFYYTRSSILLTYLILVHGIYNCVYTVYMSNSIPYVIQFMSQLTVLYISQNYSFKLRNTIKLSHFHYI